MHGLPFQSLYRAPNEPFHQPQRLLTVVYAPKERVERLIAKQPILQRLFGGGWVHLACIDPRDGQVHRLT